MTKSADKAQCVVCGGEPVERQRAYRPRDGMFSGSVVGRCARCDVLQATPMPTLEELDAYYQSQYRTSANKVSSPYENPEDVNSRTLSQVECVQQLGLKPRSIIDVGCGYGLLLKGLRGVFPEAQLSGIEVSTECHSALRQLGVSFTDRPLEREGRNSVAEQFDLLTCSHVLEHSCDPLKFLSVSRDLLRTGGTALFEVPNCEYEYGSDVPHLLFFTPKTLRGLLERSGFFVSSCRTCGPSIERWLPGRRQRLRNFVDDHVPLAVARMLKAGWRLARTRGNLRRKSESVVDREIAKLREEAKDRAWFLYDQPDFRHIAIRCVAVRKS